MCRTRRLRFAPIVCATITAVMMMRAPGLAQNVTEPALKAAFIYNFARFTAWPDGWPAAEPFVICVLGDAVADALERVVKGRQFGAHPIVVSRATPTGPHRTCHLLYITGVQSSQAAPMIAGLRDAPVLTISDIEGFNDVGGMAQLFFDRGQLRFSITLGPVKRARLQLSSKLIVLAKPHE
ncbi:MAG: YfiR family protein [Acidobacteriota bacterium]